MSASLSGCGFSAETRRSGAHVGLWLGAAAFGELLEVNTTADSPAGAQDLNAAVIDALETYITENAQQSGVPAAERVR